ncbi:MAG: alpha/beta hydrolase [Phenylobacterium sp.]|uniref:alpha/beta hydrolase n=1 Tax=Phenylobacterium sp. TaxID=1871053 RepID=UPI0027355A5B|nr:alpha/beta hydrolase [Phenylobacterium sp.]MDP3173911.1 alpha/beta hydrolase [Phenylobacterium sp.]
MKNRFVLFFFLFLGSILYSQNFTLKLWEKDLPNHIQSDEKEIIDTTDILGVRNIQTPTISVYLPSKRSANGKAVVICPGGGYRVLAYDWEGDDVAKWLNSNGIAAIVLKYRLPISKSVINKEITPFLDVQRAMRLTRYNAKKWNIKENMIGVMGFSAGGHLASTIGTKFGTKLITPIDSIDMMNDRPDFMILAYPVITFKKPLTHMGSRTALIGENADTLKIIEYSNELQVKANTPPTFIFHAEDDKPVPVENSLLFYQALKEKSIQPEMHIYTKGGHVFSISTKDNYLHDWTNRCIAWLKEYVK